MLQKQIQIKYLNKKKRGEKTQYKGKLIPSKRNWLLLTIVLRVIYLQKMFLSLKIKRYFRF